MNRRTRRRLTSLLLLTVFVGVPTRLTWRAVRQERLDRALITAIRKNDATAVVSLLKQGADADACDVPTDTRSFWRHMLERLRGRQDNPHAAQSALSLAVDWSPPFDEILLSDKANLNTAVKARQNLVIVKALLEHGASVNARNGVWDAYVTYLPGNGPGQAGTIKSVAKFQSLGLTPLMQAARHGRIETVRLLLEHGAAPNLKRRDGLTALMMVEEDGYHSITKMLKQAGAKE